MIKKHEQKTESILLFVNNNLIVKYNSIIITQQFTLADSS